MDNLATRLEEIIIKGFPELRGINILARYKKLDNAYFEFTRESRLSYKIDADRCLRKANKMILRGGLAHELAHILKEVKMNFFVSEFDRLLYNVSQSYQTWDERNADKIVIARGFGKELLAFVRYANKGREKYNEVDGLTKEEIEAALN